MLQTTMESLEENTTFPAEVIMIDNGGTDGEYLLDLTKRGGINTYIRNKNNMHFGWAWNQGAKLATSDWLCFTCNDIGFKAGWLEETLAPLVQFPKEKYIATPIITPEKDNMKYNRGTLEGGYRLNTLAGSNCMLMHRSTYEDIGEFSTHAIAGTHWHNKMHKMGYMMVATPENKVDHLASKGGFNIYSHLEVREELLTGKVIDFTYESNGNRG